ncbi:minor tail protein [Gordonia phage Emperor]|uniref:Minor tail protein n=2 Tax=root TaxID=1 RepID=A0A2Z4Q5E0_9CAUD|nr:hypothetical protein [Gordonia westfalica]YP_010674614.1 minor tail protein [Gordonia phage Emperor]AWY04763.1 minor tail protein [Gordonia phage Emperor]SDU50358.1 hypothetical protein SAMN04488548_1341646 [Gordonia westfalica]
MSTTAAGTVRPRPRLYIDGVELECGLDAEDPTVPVILDGLAINWGRDDIWDEPNTTTLTVALYDRAGAWAQRIAAAQAVGAQVMLYATEAATSFSHLVFRGQVSAVKARPRRRDRPDGEWMVTLTVADPTAGLGNATVQAAIGNTNTWPHETLRARAVRTAVQVAAASGIPDAYFDPAMVNYRVAPWEVEGNVRDLVTRLYQSTGASWTYVQHENVIRSVDRIVPRARGLLTLRRVPAVGDAGHIVTVATAPGPYDPGSSTAPWPSATVPACWAVAEDDDMEQTKTQAITRVVVKWHNWANDTGREIHTVLDDPTPPIAGRNELVHESWLSDGLDVDPMIYRLLARATAEGRRPLHPVITYDTDRTAGGFLDATAARRHLTPAETNGLVSVPGSPFADWLVYVPIFRPSGGRIEYRRGRWHITYTLQWLDLDFDGVPDMFGWGQLGHTDRLTWAGPDTVLDESISYASLENVELPATWASDWT